MGAALLAAVASAVTFPLATYALSLAALGLPHILAELRYVDARFSRRLPHALLVTLLTLGAALVALRASFAAGVLPRALQPLVELSLLAAFCAAVVPFVRARAAGVVVACAAGALAALAWWRPLPVLVCFAVLHNMTPLGFFVEAAPADARARTLLVGLLLYAGAPLAVALGVGDLALEVLGTSWRDGAPLLGAGALVEHLGTYVPPFVHGEHARRLFSAAVVGQLLHYHATLVVMPRLARAHGDAHALVRWPRGVPFVLGVGALTALLLAMFAWSFRDGRALYGIPAAFHAWIELPLLLFALTGGRAHTATGPRQS